MLVQDIKDKDIPKLLITHSEWICHADPERVYHSSPETLLEYRPLWLAANYPEKMAELNPYKLAEIRPEWIAIHLKGFAEKQGLLQKKEVPACIVETSNLE